MTISIDPAVPDDVEAMAGLMEELDTFYGATPTQPRDAQVAQIKKLVFGTPPAAQVLLAHNNGHLIGMAAYSYLWPAAGVTHSLFLKELYVVEAARRKGVGRLLMNRLHEIAVAQNCSRVEWMTDMTNIAARRFYEACGFAIHEGKLFFQVRS
ncbi:MULTISPECIES: GNAT family N-acetyltransferase [Frankia]|nr:MULTISPECIES: GNAT family N-acetyltransferase [Frankia]